MKKNKKNKNWKKLKNKKNRTGTDEPTACPSWGGGVIAHQLYFVPLKRGL